MAGLSVAMDEPAVARTRHALRNDLQLIALVLGIAAWDASVVFIVQIAEKPIAVDWLARLGNLLLGGLLCVGSGVLAVRVLSPSYPSTLHRCLRTFAAFVLGSAIGHACAGRWIYFPKVDDVVNVLARMSWSLLIYTLGAASIIGAMYWLRRGSGLRQDLHQTRLGLLALQADRAEAELMRLRTQIEPHFLFNTVATVVQLVRIDALAAHRTMARLIDYMSASRAHMRHEETTLAEEIRLTEGYLEIQRLRMESRLRYAIDVGAELRANRVPPAALLTLVENAIKHGLAPRKRGGTLRIAAHREDGWLVVSVADDGVGLTTTSGRGSGLANVRARMQGLYGDDAWLRLASGAEGGTTATLRLPAGPPPAAEAA
jgi:signal transduction histidine kinase